MKVIVIHTCGYCPYHKWADEDEWSGYVCDQKFPLYRKLPKDVDMTESGWVPEWCPLPDATSIR